MANMKNIARPLLLSFSCALIGLGSQCVLADEPSGSLIESALDGKLNAESLPSPAVPAPLVAPPSNSASKSSIVKFKPAKTAIEKPLDPNKPVAVSVPREPNYLEDKISDPKGIPEQPIHSTLNSYEKKVLFVPMGVKVGKSFALDPTYRGKPALSTLPTVSVGTPSWAIQPTKKKVAASLPTSIPNINSPISVGPTTKIPPGPLQTPQAKTDPQTGAVSTESKIENLSTLNVRVQTSLEVRPTNSVWAYPYPPKLPKESVSNPLPEDQNSLKNMILSTGYSARPNLERPYPQSGWRWIHAFQNGVKKAGVGYPHTMITMYPWVNKVFPYVASECRQMNQIEASRSERYQQLASDYERVHADLESVATARNLAPVEVKINNRGIGQLKLAPGNWWITATCKSPGLKFYWQVPVSIASGDTTNVQLTEANALIISGGW